MSPMQHELYARMALDDRRREVARFRATRPTGRAWRGRVGTILVGAGEHLRDAGRRLQHAPAGPVVAPCAD